MCPSDTPIEIKKVSSLEDWQFIRALCVSSAAQPVDASRAPFFAELWVGPYQSLRPEWTYVAWLKDERVGYLTCAPDTQKFETQRRFLFYFPLALRVFLGKFILNGDSKLFLKRFFKRTPWMENFFSKKTLEEILQHYPAHLHMNVEAKYRGWGVGRLLLDRLRADLKAKGVLGIHLYCGEPPLPFYVRLGFKLLEKIETKPGVVVYALGSTH